MSNMKKAARTGSAELGSSIAAAAAGAKARLRKLDSQSVDQLAGGVEGLGDIVKEVTTVVVSDPKDITTMGMFPSGNEGVGGDDIRD